MDNKARIEQSVFDILRPHLRRYRGDAASVTGRVRSAIDQTTSRAESLVNDKRLALDRAIHALEACLHQENSDCSGLREHVDRCQFVLQEAIRGRDLIRQASITFSASGYLRNIDELVLRAEKIVRAADERTTAYQKAAQTFSTTQAGGGHEVGEFAASSTPLWRELPGVSVPAHFPEGFALIPVDLIISDDPVPDAGQESRALRWSVDALLDVVLPAMSSVADVGQYLRDRDAREQPPGGRSYCATYSDFFTRDSAIRLRPRSDGRFDLVNGRHWVGFMARAGAGCVPALIGGAMT
jgi:hypothetical protein